MLLAEAFFSMSKILNSSRWEKFGISEEDVRNSLVKVSEERKVRGPVIGYEESGHELSCRNFQA
jgi:hypothetical protein